MVRNCLLQAGFAVAALLGSCVRASAQSATRATAVLNSPENDYTGVNYISYSTGQITFAQVGLDGSMFVSADGPANGNFYVDWNMWIKTDGNSVVPNDTSHGSILQTFDGMGHWEHSAHLSGTWTGNEGRHTAEAGSVLVVGTQSMSEFDVHHFLIVTAYTP